MWNHLSISNLRISENRYLKKDFTAWLHQFTRKYNNYRVLLVLQKYYIKILFLVFDILNIYNK